MSKKDRGISKASQLQASIAMKIQDKNDYIVTKCFDKDIKKYDVKENDVIKIESYTNYTNTWIISVKKLLHQHENNLLYWMKKVDTFPKPISEFEIGQIVVICKTKDEKMYRARINAINRKLQKIKVSFIDYGDDSIEPINNVCGLPFYASTIPSLASFIILENVPKLPHDSIIAER